MRIVGVEVYLNIFALSLLVSSDKTSISSLHLLSLLLDISGIFLDLLIQTLLLLQKPFDLENIIKKQLAPNAKKLTLFYLDWTINLPCFWSQRIFWYLLLILFRTFEVHLSFWIDFMMLPCIIPQVLLLHLCVELWRLYSRTYPCSLNFCFSSDSKCCLTPWVPSHFLRSLLKKLTTKNNLKTLNTKLKSF